MVVDKKQKKGGHKPPEEENKMEQTKYEKFEKATTKDIPDEIKGRNHLLSKAVEDAVHDFYKDGKLDLSKLKDKEHNVKLQLAVREATMQYARDYVGNQELDVDKQVILAEKLYGIGMQQIAKLIEDAKGDFSRDLFYKHFGEPMQEAGQKMLQSAVGMLSIADAPDIAKAAGIDLDQTKVKGIGDLEKLLHAADVKKQGDEANNAYQTAVDAYGKAA